MKITRQKQAEENPKNQKPQNCFFSFGVEAKLCCKQVRRFCTRLSFLSSDNHEKNNKQDKSKKKKKTFLISSIKINFSYLILWKFMIIEFPRLNQSKNRSKRIVMLNAQLNIYGQSQSLIAPMTMTIFHLEYIKMIRQQQRKNGRYMPRNFL